MSTYPGHSVTVDAVARDERGRFLLIRRGRDPYKGLWAFPGGFVDIGEMTSVACLRELKEETGLDGRIIRLLGVFDDPDRDPRGPVISIAYEVGIIGGTLEAGDDAAHAEWVDTNPLSPLDMAFDHFGIMMNGTYSAEEWLDHHRLAESVRDMRIANGIDHDGEHRFDYMWGIRPGKQ